MSSVKWDIREIMSQHSSYVDRLIQVRKFNLQLALILILILCHVHVLMRDEKEGRKKQAMSNKQRGKATQHTQGCHFS